MPIPQDQRPSDGLSLPRLAVLVALLAGLFFAIAMLALDVRSRLAELGSSDSDNGQWVVMRSEVEALRLTHALLSADTPSEALPEVRRWYDVFYSRVRLLEESPLYKRLMSMPANKAELDILSAFIDRWTPVFDGSETALIAALPALEADLDPVMAATRRLSLEALRDFSSSSDATREAISETLLRLAITITATILLLAVLVAVLAALYRVAGRRAEESRRTGNRLQMIIETSPDAIIVTNRGGWVLEFNPVAEVMFGISRAQILGRNAVATVFPPGEAEEVQRVISEAIAETADRGPQRIEIEGRRTDGTRFPLELSIAISDIARGMIIVGFIRDISERRAAEEALREALIAARDSERTRADFLAVMSHEMRTPLNGLIGATELMLGTRPTPEQAEILRVLEVSGSILLGHVNSVLDIARAEAGEIQFEDRAFDLDALIADCLANQDSLARAAGNRLEHRPLSGPLGRVAGDAGRLRQILLNLVGNAVKFTAGGSITLETERLTRAEAEGRRHIIEFRVIDTGIGVPEADQQRIFDDFVTLDSGYDRRSGGTGLGLAIVRRLVRAMGGTLGVESEPGQGSVFWIRVPLPPVAEARAPVSEAEGAAVPHAGAQGRGLDILVIEDNEINRFLLRRYLEAEGHRVTEAFDGVQGVAAAEARRFDLILTDISMPRMDGVEATRAIRSGGGPSAGARIVAVTAHAQPREQARFRAAGMEMCLTKPITREMLVSAIEGIAPAGNPAPSPGLVDAEALDEMALRLGEATLRGLVDRLIVDAEATLARISRPGLDPEEAARLCHHLSGACAAFGAARLREGLARAEAELRAGRRGEGREALGALPLLWSETKAALQGAIEKAGA